MCDTSAKEEFATAHVMNFEQRGHPPALDQLSSPSYRGGVCAVIASVHELGVPSQDR